MKRALLLATIFYVSCGPLIPNTIDVVVSGDVTFSPSLTDLQQFFIQECQTQLGVGASAADVQSCAAQDVQAFVNFMAAVGKAGS